MTKKGAECTVAKATKGTKKATSGAERLKRYFEKNPNKIIEPKTLSRVAGIQDWTRTIRSIRSKYDMNIVYVRADGTSPSGYKYIPK